MWLILIVLLVLIIISISFKNKKIEKFSYHYEYNIDPAINETAYFSAYRTPLVQGDRNHRKLFDSLTYDFPYLKAIN